MSGQHVGFNEQHPPTFRARWQVSVSASTLRSMAENRLEYHQRRRRHWETQVAKAQEALHASVELREHAVTGGKQTVAVLDAEKQSHLSDVQSRLVRHRQDELIYSTWVNFLTQASGMNFAATHEDLMFFALPVGIENEEEADDA